MQIILSTFFNLICIFGLGSIFLNTLKNLKMSLSEVFFLKISFGIFFSGLISILINFIHPINLSVSNIFTCSFFLIGGYFLFKERLNFHKFFYIFLILTICLIIMLKSSNVEDFGLYHGPYISILNNEKIIFGLTNIHFRFGHTSLLQNSQAIFNNSLFYPNNFQTLSAIFYSSFLIYIINFLLNEQNLKKTTKTFFFFFCILVLICTKIYRYNDFGNDLIPNLLNFYIWIKCFLILFENKKKINHRNFNNNIIILLGLYLLSVFLKIQSLLSFIPIIFIIFYFKHFIIKKKIFKTVLIFFFPAIIIFLSKNFITSGCLIYPIEKLCFKKIEWSSSNLLSKSQPDERSIQSEAWAKGWPQRLNNDISYNEFIKNFNWIDAWSKVHLKVIIKKITIPLTIILLFFIYYSYLNFRKIKTNITLLNFFFISIIPNIIWFIKFPLYRYGYSSIYISLFLALIIFFQPSKKLINSFKKISRLILVIFFIFVFLNFSRIFSSTNINEWPSVKDPAKNQNIIRSYEVENIIVKNNLCFYTKKICTNYKIDKKVKFKKINNYLFIYF